MRPRIRIFWVTALSLLSVIAMNAACQEARVVYKINNLPGGEKTISLKWYSEELIYREGCNIYRRELPSGLLIKCTSSPVFPILNNTVKINSADSSVLFFVELLKNKAEIFKDGILKLYLLVQSFSSDELSGILGIQFQDTILNIENKYIYYVHRIRSGSESLLAKSDTVDFFVKKNRLKIQNFSCLQKKDRIEIKWQPGDSLFYAVNIYRKEFTRNYFSKRNDEPLMISSNEDINGNYRLPEVFFTDTIENYRMEVQYYLKGIDFFGEESYSSDSIKITFHDSIPPGVVTDLKLVSNESKLNISWKNPSDNDFKGCNIYRSFKSENSFSQVNRRIVGQGEHQFIDTVPEAGFWYYKIGSIDSSGNENLSGVLYTEVHDLKAPEAPSELEIREDSATIHLSWKRNDEKDIEGYLVYRSLARNRGIRPLLLNSCPLKDTLYLDKNIRSKNEIIYQIAAIDFSSNVSKRSQAVHIRLKDMQAPTKPEITEILPGNKIIRIQWLRNPEHDLKGYRLSRKSNNEPEVDCIISIDSTSFTDTSLIPDRNYEYDLFAFDSAGNYSQPCIRSGVKINGIDKIIACNHKVIKAKFKKYIRLTWDSEQARGVIGYSIFALDSNNSYFRKSEVIHENEFIEKNVVKGKTYLYQLRTYFVDGNVCVSEPVKIDIPVQ